MSGNAVLAKTLEQSEKKKTNAKNKDVLCLFLTLLKEKSLLRI
jgi:hypothetical protein